MADVRPNALFVGNLQVAAALEQFYGEDWNFYSPVETIDELWDGLENGTINNNIEILLVLDILFDPKGNKSEFEDLIVSLAPYCFLGIVNYRPDLNDVMRERIDQYFQSSDKGDLEKLLYYFIDPKAPGPSVDRAMNQFSKECLDDELVYRVTGNSIDSKVEIQEQHQTNTGVSNDTDHFSTYDDDEKSDYLGQILAVTSSKGGSGKSTVAVTLATYIAHASEISVKKHMEERPLKVIIVDLDVRDGQLGFLTNKSKPTVVNIIAKGISRDVLNSTIIPDKRLKCDLLLAPKRPRLSDDIPPEFYVELLQQLRRDYDYIILDTSVNYLDTLLEKVAYPMSDQIIFVTDIVRTSVFSMTRWIQEVTTPKEEGGMGINKNKIGIVVNKSLQDVAMPPSHIERAALDLQIISFIPSQPKLIAHAANTNSMDFLLTNEAIAGSIRRLARAVVGKKYKLAELN